MTRVYILAEGQTEEIFINEVLAPHYNQKGLYFYPIIVRTSPGNKGGISTYSKIHPQIQRLCKQDINAITTTMFDLYGLPSDFPGFRRTGIGRTIRGVDHAHEIEAALENFVGLTNFVPNIVVHEFEALLFTEVDAFFPWFEKIEDLNFLRRIREEFSPEEINNHPLTAPSKRILSIMPNYQKTLHGPLIAKEIGLQKMREHCPHFDGWLKKLEKLL